MSKTPDRPLRRIRKARDLRLWAVARGAGVEQAWLSRVERGEIRNPAHEKVMRLARFFGVDPEVIFPTTKGRAA